MLVALAALALAASPADDQRADVERAVFDLCPRATAGTLALGDAAQMQTAGYTPTEPRQTPGGPNPRAVRGEGTSRIVISAKTGERPICSVWFGGPENSRLADAIRRRARTEGFEGGDDPMRLGDGTRLYSFRRGSDSLVIFDADAGGELDFDPATTVVLMTGIN